MSRDDAKRALDTIEILKRNSTYTYSDGIAIINNLMKRSFADGKQYMRDQQENAIEMWRLVDSSGHVIPGDHQLFEDAKCWRDELQEKNPKLDFDDYEPKLFREVMDNE